MSKIAANRWKALQLPAVVLLMQIALLLTVTLDIPVARQVIGFFYLTFVPGFAILRLLELKLGIVASSLFAAGLSIAFLMGVGFFMNLLGPLFDISEPLALIPMMVVINVVVLLLLFLEWRNYGLYAFSGEYKNIAAVGLVLCTILILSVIGTLLVNTSPHNNNSVLLFMLIFISVLVGLAALSRRLVPHEFYPLILFAIALALLFHVSLFSNYITGGDIFAEYQSYRLTLSALHWDPTISSRLYAMLSITILPTIYSTVLNLEGTWLFKIIYPLIFALVPVGLYELFKSKVSKEVALFSVFFFVANSVFFNEIVELARQMIGELFYILLFLTLLNKNLKVSSKWVCFGLFSFGLVVSHYAMYYIFLSFAFVAWLFAFLRKRKSAITVSMIIFLSVVGFAWYIYISQSTTFDALVSNIENIQQNFASDFLNPQSRGSQVLQGVGVEGLGTFWHFVGRYTYYATEVLVVIGLLSLLLKQRRSFFADDYNVIAFFNMLLVVACIVVPNLATTFNMTRFYHVSLFFLAPFLVVGGIVVLRFFSRKRVKEKYIMTVVVLAVLIPFFLFQTGFVYEVTREDSWALPISAYRFSALKLSSIGVLGEGEVSGAIWLSQSSNSKRYVYADIMSRAIFAYVGVQNSVWLSLAMPIIRGSYLYLSDYNVFDGVVLSSYGSEGSFNVTQLVPNPSETDLIYCSGSCEIYQVP